MAERPVRPRDRFLTFGAPDIGEAEIAEVVDCLRSGWLGTGPKVARFEREFGAYMGTDPGVALASCTAALQLGMLVAGVGEGDEVLTTAMTFCATANAIVHAGATPILVDVERETMNLDPARLEEAITPRTKAILPVHFAGRPCDMEAICAIAERHDLKVIEDCAHAIETTYKGRRAGTFGDVGCFSFYVTKNVTTGEGGMVLCRREEDASRLKILALHGMSKDAWKRYGDEGYVHYQLIECGFKYNMTDMAAAIGIHQLARVEENWQRRHAVSERYQKELADLPLVLPAESEPDTRHAHHLFPVLVDEAAPCTRDEFLERMTRENIGVGVHYVSLPEQPFYQEKFGWRPDHYPEAMRIGRRTVSLPLSPRLTDDDVDDVVAAVRKVLG